MSASLVGSEMCIRDSFVVDHGASGAARSQTGHPPPRRLQNGAFGSSAVSYTHLTLPTICSV
eukprot:10230169-Alexandrium_andersonii.AAC.1